MHKESDFFLSFSVSNRDKLVQQKEILILEYRLNQKKSEYLLVDYLHRQGSIFVQISDNIP
jgi:hypothetical protein